MFQYAAYFLVSGISSDDTCLLNLSVSVISADSEVICFFNVSLSDINVDDICLF